MQFEKASDYNVNARFSSAQKAVDSYQNLLQKMVSSGSMIEPGTARRWLPDATFFEKFESTMDHHGNLAEARTGKESRYS